jgi:hypothetical protein
LQNALHIGTEDTAEVQIGYLENYRSITAPSSEDEQRMHEVIHAGRIDDESDETPGFVVYEDGHLIAKGAEFHGEIFASGGKIGGMEISQVENTI